MKEMMAGEVPKATRFDVTFSLVMAAGDLVENCGRANRWPFYYFFCTPFARVHPGGALPSI